MERPRILRFLLLTIFGQAAMFLTYFALYAINAAARLDFLIVQMFLGRRGPPGVIGLALLIGTWLVLGLVSIIVGVGLRRGRPWAWTAALTLEGAILVLALERYVERLADMTLYVAMAVAVAAVLFLNQREIQTYFRADFTPVEGKFRS